MLGYEAIDLKLFFLYFSVKGNCKHKEEKK